MVGKKIHTVACVLKKKVFFAVHMHAKAHEHTLIEMQANRLISAQRCCDNTNRHTLFSTPWVPGAPVGVATALILYLIK